MAYLVPGASDLKSRFPVFAGVDDGVVEACILEGARRVDDTWSEDDFAPAILLGGAHVLTLDGHGSHPEAQTAPMMAFKGFKSGPLSVQRDQTSHGNVLAVTSYGRRFLELMRRNVPTILTV
ncbi:MAG: DUF4054 domain-containing protein [Maricaulis sp.]|jgi:hypothetical protein|nr:DUF4054 domain-containing protein [Maricaulis sp.]